MEVVAVRVVAVVGLPCVSLMVIEVLPGISLVGCWWWLVVVVVAAVRLP